MVEQDVRVYAKLAFEKKKSRKDSSNRKNSSNREDSSNNMDSSYSKDSGSSNNRLKLLIKLFS